MHYNTTAQTGETLRQHKAGAKEQESRILEYMTNQRGVPFTAEMIEAAFVLPRTSVSRALANLTANGEIEKSSKARWKSSYGRACHAWRVRPEA